MYYQNRISDILQELNSSESGLKSNQIAELRRKYGYNQLQEKEKISTIRLFLESFKDPLVIILLIAAGVQILLGHLVDSLIILTVLMLNSIIGVIQAKKAEGSLDALKQLSAPQAKVIRDGEKQVISAKEILPGDIILLDAGDYIPADGRLIEAGSLKVMEGILTGESEPILKHCDIIKKEVPLGDRKNMVFSGTIVVYGRGMYVVTATSMNTEIGKIADLLENTDSGMTPLQENLEKFTQKLGVGILGISILIFGIILFKEFVLEKDPNIWASIINAFMFAVAVAVAAIPEALSSIVTIVLSVGTNIMAKKNAIIRKLPAVETLGSTSIICTDKTGTLTQNKMTVVDYYMHGVKEKNNFKNILSGEEINPSLDKYHEKKFLLASVLANDSSVNNEGKEIGDPTEIALVNFAIKHKIDIGQIRDLFKRIGELPFDSDRKIMSTLHQIGEKIIMFSKGAPDIILGRCVNVLENGKILNLSDEIKACYKEKNEEFSNNALRVLALAFKEINIPSDKKDNYVLALDEEIEMTFVGLVAMIDPPREEVFDAISEAKNAGIKSIMITGDHKTTAAAIAKQIGLMSPDEKAITGQELDLLTEEELDRDLEKISVYARVSPENKIRIVKAWQKKGKITAMTGDGVNDAPALKQSDIGIAMGTGTDVAKDASAMVLTDDNFATIVHAIEIGRTVYDNIKKAITYLFIGNLGAILTILFALLVGWNSPFTALQLLFINLVNDSIPAIALGLEKSRKNIMNMQPRSPKEPLFNKQAYSVIFIRGLFIAIVTIIAQYIGGTKEVLGMSMAFTTLIFSRILQTLPARSNEETVFSLGLFSNKYVIIAIAVCFGLYTIVLIPEARGFFGIAPNFGIHEIQLCLELALMAVLFMELEKIIIKLKK